LKQNQRDKYTKEKGEQVVPPQLNQIIMRN